MSPCRWCGEPPAVGGTRANGPVFTGCGSLPVTRPKRG